MEPELRQWLAEAAETERARQREQARQRAQDAPLVRHRGPAYHADQALFAILAAVMIVPFVLSAVYFVLILVTPL